MDGKCYKAVFFCGKVHLTIGKLPGQFIVCHCDTCRKWNGGPQFAIPCGTDVEIQGKYYVSEFASSPLAKRGFCRNCGTHLYFKLNQSGNYTVQLGVLGLDKSAKLNISMQYFIDLKPDCYHFENDSPVITEAEVIEKFS